MAACKKDIRRWLNNGIKNGATHVIVVCDTYDHRDYPVYVKPSQSVNEKVTFYQSVSMQRVMEVYNLSVDIEAQLNQFRAWNL